MVGRQDDNGHKGPGGIVFLVRHAMINFIRNVRARLGPLWWYSILISASARFNELLNLYVGFFYLPKALSANELGSVEPITRLASLGGIPLAIASIVAAKYLSVYHARGEKGKIKRLMRDMSLIAMVSSVIAVATLIVGFEAIRTRLHLQTPYLLLTMGSLALLACWQPLVRVVLQGTQRFYAGIAMGTADSVLRLSMALLLIPLLHLSGYLLTLLICGIAAIAIGIWSIREFWSSGVKSTPYYSDWQGILSFAWPAAVLIIFGGASGTIEPFVIKHFLSIEDAAGYYMVCRLGYIPSYIVGSIGFVLFPILSHRHERGEDTGGYLRQSLLVTIIGGTAACILVGSCSSWLMGLLPQWRPYQPYAPQVWFIGAMVVLDLTNSIYFTREMACRRFSFLWISIPIVLAECTFLYCSFGWSALQDYLPQDFWKWADSVMPHTLTFALTVMVAARAAVTIGLALHWHFTGTIRPKEIKT